MKGQSAYLTTQRLLGGLLCVVGLGMVVTTLVRGGGPFALGVVVGLSFALLGAGRVWLARPVGADSE